MFFQSVDCDSDNPYEDLKRRRQDYDFVKIDHSADVIADLLKVLRQGSQNDIRILCSDGEIQADKDILCLRSEYFRVMFRCDMEETMTGVVSMEHTHKRAMEVVIEYIFTGQMELKWEESDEEIIKTLLEIINTSRIMMLDKLCTHVETLVAEMLPHKISNLTDLVQGLMLAEKYQLDAVRDTLLRYVVLNLKQIIERRIEKFFDLPGYLIKEILWFDKVKAEEREKLIAFEFWLSHNPQIKVDELMNEIIETSDPEEEEEVLSDMSSDEDEVD